MGDFDVILVVDLELMGDLDEGYFGGIWLRGDWSYDILEMLLFMVTDEV